MQEQDNLTYQLGFRISEDLRSSLEELAKADYRTVSNYVRIVLENHVKEQSERKTEKEPKAA